MARVRRLSWDRVLGWRMRRMLLEPIAQHDVVDVVGALAGVQAQVASSAELAIALRRSDGTVSDAAGALGSRRLLRTWAMRGTLHLLTPALAPSVLALMASLRSWERPAWERSFGLSPADVAALAEAVSDVLDGRVLEREELIEAIAARSGSRELDEHLRSGWGAILKPLAWMGLLCNGPNRGNRVTFTTPAGWIEGWPGLPDPDDAARTVITAYLRAFGPATPVQFDAWLSRGSTRKADVRRWFGSLEDDLVTVEVEGESRVLLRDDLDELLASAPSEAVRLLGGFDQYILGPGTGEASILAPERRRHVSKAAGWIAPIVVSRARVAGVWELDGDALVVSLFPESGPVDERELAAQAEWLRTRLGRSAELKLGTI